MAVKPFAQVGNFTTFPNEVLDYIMPECAPNTWKIVCATIRKTVGWHKEEEWISIALYMRLTGIQNRTTCSKAIQDALKAGYLIRKPYRNGYVYSLNKDHECTETIHNEVTPSTETVPLDSTETVPIKETIKRNSETNVSRGLLKHPALVAYRDAAHLQVISAMRETVIDVVGEREDDVALWHRTVRAWVGSGWNPRNVRGMLEYFREQRTPTEDEFERMVREAGYVDTPTS